MASEEDAPRLTTWALRPHLIARSTTVVWHSTVVCFKKVKARRSSEWAVCREVPPLLPSGPTTDRDDPPTVLAFGLEMAGPVVASGFRASGVWRPRQNGGATYSATNGFRAHVSPGRASGGIRTWASERFPVSVLLPSSLLRMDAC